jgi:hypothetical protein
MTISGVDFQYQIVSKCAGRQTGAHKTFISYEVCTETFNFITILYDHKFNFQSWQFIVSYYSKARNWFSDLVDSWTAVFKLTDLLAEVTLNELRYISRHA